MNLNLRDRGIYQLPNGRELVALVNRGKPTIFYKLGEPERLRYVLNESNRLVFQGRLTAWSIDDLKDTGRTETSLSVAVDLGNSDWIPSISEERR